MDDGEDSSVINEDRFMVDMEDDKNALVSVNYPSMDTKGWAYVGDCARLFPQCIQRIREFFEGRPGITRAQCHEHVRLLVGRADATVVPAEAQFAGAYTVEVTTPGQDKDSMTLFQFRASGADVGGADRAVFGRFVPERCDKGELAPSGTANTGNALRVWQLRCARGRPLAYVMDRLSNQNNSKNQGRLEAIMGALAELITLPLTSGAGATWPDEGRERLWTTFKDEVLPSLPRPKNKPRETSEGDKEANSDVKLEADSDVKMEVDSDVKMKVDPDGNASPSRDAVVHKPSSMEEEELDHIFEPSWPWTPHNHGLSDMSILIEPGLSRIATVLDWCLSPLPFGASLSVSHSLLGFLHCGAGDDFPGDKSHDKSHDETHEKSHDESFHEADEADEADDESLNEFDEEYNDDEYDDDCDDECDDDESNDNESNDNFLIKWPKPKDKFGDRSHWSGEYKADDKFRDEWIDYPEHHDEPWRFLLHSVRRRLLDSGTTGTAPDVCNTRKILTAAKFAFALDYVPKMVAGDSRRYSEWLLSQTVDRFDHLLWDEEHFKFNMDEGRPCLVVNLES
ncbi:hypothetical protein FJTKL_15369 [Diaporthe vaccinii]|uniref:Uncharacterized protein n=1 Tax=Diaporthe vaccinii TaxID=105482 RepID=A0ABR4E546_9PEZI